MTNGHPGYIPAPLQNAINQAQAQTNQAIAAWDKMVNRDPGTIKADDIRNYIPREQYYIADGVIKGLAISAPYTLGAKTAVSAFLLKGGLDAAQQYAVKGDINRVDFLDATITGFPLPKSPISELAKDALKSEFNFNLSTGFSLNEDAVGEFLLRQGTNSFMKKAVPNPAGFQQLGVDLSKKIMLGESKKVYDNVKLKIKE